MHDIPRLLAATLLIGSLAGCPSAPLPPEDSLPPAPTVVSFRARQVQMEDQIQLLLEWETTGATEVTITDSNRGLVSGVDNQPSGAVEIAALEKDTLFVLVAKNARGASASAMATARPFEGQGEILFVATPGEIQQGEPVTLAWSAPGFSSFALTANDLPLEVSGSASHGTLEVHPTRNTVYKFSAGGREVTSAVIVNSAVKSFAISDESARPGERLTLTWETTGATQVVLSEGHAGELFRADLAQQPHLLASGRYAFTVPTESSLEDIFEFALEMTDTNGELHEARVTAYVSGRPRLVAFSAPALARTGSTFPVSWTALSVDRAEVSVDGAVVYRSPDRAVASKGSIALPTPAKASTYRLTAFNERGGSDFREFSIEPVGAPVILNAGISPTVLEGGTRAELTWAATSARRAVIRNPAGQPVLQFSGRAAEGGLPVELYPNASGAYTLEIDNGLEEYASEALQPVTVNNPVVLVPNAFGEIILGSQVQVTPSIGGPGTLLYGVVHTDYVEQVPSSGFIDIAATGQKINTNTSITTSTWFKFTPVGFSPLVFGQPYAGVISVCPSGQLTFQDMAESGCSTVNKSLPATAIDDRALAPLWESLEVRPDFGGIFWEVVGAGDERVLVVQWERVNFNLDDDSEFTFQVQVRLDGSVRFEYATMRPGPSTSFKPNVGIQLNSTVAADYPVTPAAYSRLEFLGPKPSPFVVTVDGNPVHARLKLNNSFMSVSWTPANILHPGDLTFSEVMSRPAGEVAETGEYFELYNRTSRDVSLSGFSVKSATSGDTLVQFDASAGNVVVPARGYLVVGQSADPSENDGAKVAYAYGTPVLGDLEDSLVLEKQVPMDKLTYKWSPEDPPGVALVFDPNPFILATDTQPTVDAVPHPISCPVAEDEVFGSQTPPQRGTPGSGSRCFDYTYSRIDADFVDLSQDPAARKLFVDGTWTSGLETIDLSELPIPAFGTERTELKVNPNGWLTFKMSVTSTTAPHGSTTVKPTSSTPDASLVPFGRDLRGGDPASNVFMRLMPEDFTRVTPEPHWLFQWHKAEIASSTGPGNLNFEVKLFKDGTVEFHYGTMEGLSADGSDSVTWIESEDGTKALTIGAQSAVLSSDTAYRFSP